jgi:glutaredoxin 3
MPAKRPPCGVHGLAAGPDGQCVLCRRAVSAPVPAPVARVTDGAPLASRVLTLLIGVAALASAGAAGAFALGMLEPRGPRLGRELPGMLGAASGPRAEPTRNDPRPSEPASAERDPESPAQYDPTQNDRIQNDPSPEEAERLRRSQLETAERDHRRSEMIDADRQALAAKQARSNVTVVMYSTSWCPSCNAARSYMSQHGIIYEDYDIEQNESARISMQRLNPRGSIPTIDIGGSVMIGFSAARLEHELDRAARAHAGI